MSKKQRIEQLEAEVAGLKKAIDVLELRLQSLVSGGPQIHVIPVHQPEPPSRPLYPYEQQTWCN